MDWRKGKGYADAEGYFYHVVPVNDKFAVARYAPDKAGAEFVTGLEWKTTAGDAQRDLDAMAAEKGWTEQK
jgi:hypothetical protein